MVVTQQGQKAASSVDTNEVQLVFHPTPTPQATRGPDCGHPAHVYGLVQTLCTAHAQCAMCPQCTANGSSLHGITETGCPQGQVRGMLLM